MQNMTNLQKKNLVNNIFVAILLLLINFSISLEFRKVSYSFSATGIAASIILMVGLNKYRKENSKLNILFYMALIYLFVLIVSPFVMMLVLNKHMPNMGYLVNLMMNLETIGELDFNQLNKIMEFLVSLKEPIAISLILSLVFSEIPLCAMIYFSGKTLLFIGQDVSSSYGEEAHRYAKKTIISALVTSIIALVVVLLMFEGLSGILFTYVGDVMFVNNAQSLLTISGALSIPLMVVSIMYLVFFIKFLVRINKLASDINVNQDNNLNDYQE